MAIGVERPGAAATNILSGGFVGVDTSDQFTIKTWEANADYNTVVADITGDGDDYPCFAHNGYLYGSVVFRGAMVADEAIGLSVIANLTTNDGGKTVKINYGASEAHTIDCIAERVRILQRWRSPFVGVEVTVRMHNTDPEAIESDDADA